MSQGSSAPATPAPAASVPQLAQGAAQAIVSGLAGAPEADRSAGVEISLDPPELGRVRMSFVEVGGTVVLSILAERPETAELMRRHLDILGQEFARAGLEAPSVRVDSNGDQGFGRNDAKPDADGHGPAPGAGETGAGTGTPETATGTLRPGMSGHALDLRL
jgi:flagellar hook-length control protein FliK